MCSSSCAAQSICLRFGPCVRTGFGALRGYVGGLGDVEAGRRFFGRAIDRSCKELHGSAGSGSLSPRVGTRIGWRPHASSRRTPAPNAGVRRPPDFFWNGNAPNRAESARNCTVFGMPTARKPAWMLTPSTGAVTPGVAGSSPVHSANKINGLALQGANPFSFLGPSGVNQGVNRAVAVRGAPRTATNNVTFAVCAHGQGRAVPRSCSEQPGARHASVYLHIDQAQRAHPLREPFPPSGKHVMLAVSGQPFDRVHHRDCRAVGRAIADSVKAYDVLEVRVRAGIHSKVEDDDRQQAFGGKGSTSCDA
jgi:hypothetical protein